MRRALLCLPLLAACTGLQPTRIYAGPQRPIAGACDPATTASLTRRGHAIILAPANGTLALEGQIVGTAVAAKATLLGVDKKPYPLTFAGTLAGATIDGTLNTPRCRYALSLALTDD